jgi:hypothetical protein
LTGSKCNICAIQTILTGTELIFGKREFYEKDYLRNAQEEMYWRNMEQLMRREKRRASHRFNKSLLNILAVEPQRRNVLILLMFDLAHAHFETGHLTCSFQREICSKPTAHPKDEYCKSA